MTDGTVWGNVTLYTDGTTYYADLGPGQNYTVWKTIGGSWKQRYLTEIGNSKYILPIQWNTADAQWTPDGFDLGKWFDVPDTPKVAALAESWDRRCAGCHTTGTDITFNSTSGEWVANYNEVSIACEACHGPGSDHFGNPDFIWKSADAQVCGQCHSTGDSLGQLGGMTLGYPWNVADGHFSPGDILTDFFDLSDPATNPTRFWPNNMSKTHEQQYIDWEGTPHSDSLSTIVNLPYGQDFCLECHSTDYWLAVEAGDTPPTKTEAKWSNTCVRCHTPHGTTANDAQLRLSRDDTCGQCHSAGDTGPGQEPHHPELDMMMGQINITGLSGSPWMTGAPTCSNCHMTKVATSASTGDIPSHTFEFVAPELTTLYGMPNGCTSVCHDGTTGFVQTPAQAQTAIDGWKASYATKIAEVEPVVTAAEAALAAAPNLGFTQTQIDAATADYEEGLFAYQFSESDNSGGAHNNQFQLSILDHAQTKAQAVIDALTPGTVSGRVVDADGNPVAGAQIRVGTFPVANASGDGTFSFDYAPGSHTFTLYVNGEEAGTFTATVTAGQTTDAGDVEAEEEAPPPPADNTMLYLAIAIILIIVILAAVAAMMRRRPGAPVEAAPEEEEYEEM